MAATYMDPSGDATFTIAVSANGGFYGTATNTIVTDIVHGGHVKSIKPTINSSAGMITINGTLVDAGYRQSIYLYINALPTATTAFWIAQTTGAAAVNQLKLTSAGVLQLFEATAQIGSNGATLSTGTWYRISIAATLASTSSNRFEVFKDGVSTISVTNATLTRIGSNRSYFGYDRKDGTFDTRFSDLYIDNSSALTDISSDVWVTAKRTFSNGTTNGFTTQIGSGGSGYGSGHAPQVNERPISQTNGWTMVGAGSATTEEYNIESASAGDIDISSATIIEYMGWLYAKSLAPETATGILSTGLQSWNVALTSTAAMFLYFSSSFGSTTYPPGTGTDIGIVTTTALTTVSLYECGVIVAYNPTVTGHHFLQMLGVS